MNFVPHNALEEQLVAVHTGTLAPETFVLQLIDQQLFMPVRDEKNQIQGFQRSTQAEPLIIETEDGERVLVLFTSPERAKPFVEHFPDFKGGLLTIVPVVIFLVMTIGILGITIERIAYRPLRSSGRLAPVISALGVAFILESGARNIWGASYKVYPPELLPPGGICPG